MSEPIVLESNQNHATITDNGICPTLSAAMGMGGGYVPMVVVGAEGNGRTEKKVRCGDDKDGECCDENKVSETEE